MRWNNREVSGEHNKNSKLTELYKLCIWECRHKDWPPRRLAKVWCVAISTIHRIQREHRHVATYVG